MAGKPTGAQVDRLFQPNPNAPTVATLNSLQLCRTGAIVILAQDGASAVVVPLACKSWRCPTCGPRVRHIWANKIAAAKPERFITLTCDPTRFSSPHAAYLQTKAAFPKLVRQIRQRWGEFEYAAVWDYTEAGYPHIHIAQRGRFISQRWLSAAWDLLGVGRIVDIRRVHGTAAAARYLTKYMAKATRSQEPIPHKHRLVSCSRHYQIPAPPDPAPLLEHPPIKMRLRTHIANVVEDLWTFGGLALDLPSTDRWLTFSRPQGPMTDLDLEILIEHLTDSG